MCWWCGALMYWEGIGVLHTNVDTTMYTPLVCWWCGALMYWEGIGVLVGPSLMYWEGIGVLVVWGIDVL